MSNLDDVNFDKKILTIVNKIEEVDENGEPLKLTSSNIQTWNECISKGIFSTYKTINALILGWGGGAELA